MSGPVSINPVEVLSEGFMLQLVRLTGEPRQCHGAVLEVGPARLVARLDTPVALEPGERVLLVAHLREGRFLGSALVSASQAGRTAFAIENRWDALDVRNHPRYALSLGVRVVPPAGRKVSGVMSDVSLGGARVTVTEPVTNEALLLEVEDGGFGAWLPCHVVGSEETGGTVVLHLEFADLTPPQFAFVRNLVAHARELAAGPRGGRLAA